MARVHNTANIVLANKARAKHGLWKSSEYQVWASMKQRCCNERNSHYHRYGGRGLTVCDEWKDDFERFYADMGPRPEGATLDRIDNDKGYSPENCRWAERKQQSNNRGVTLTAEFRGECMPLADVARVAGIPYHQVFQRYKRGLRGEDLIRKHKVGRKPAADKK